MTTLSIPLIVQLLILVLLSSLSIWFYQSCSSPVITTLASTNKLLSNTSQFISKTDCRQSLLESDGFICESDSIWNERKVIYRAQDKENMMKRPNTYYFHSNWEPNFHCSHARRVGAMGDGGKWICDVFRLKLRPNCLIYSVGSSGDFSFEIQLKEIAPNCEIYTFDKINYTCPMNICIFHQAIFGDGITHKNSKNWTTIIKELNHVHRTIDLLKIDIEGGEYTFFPDIFNSNRKSFPRQILSELHPINVTIVHGFFELLRKNNYVIFSKENNILGGPYFFEFGFLKLNSRFFSNLRLE